MHFEYDYKLKVGALKQDDGYRLMAGLSARYPFLHGRESIQLAPRGDRFHIRGITPEEAWRLENGWAKVGTTMIAWDRHMRYDARPYDKLFCPIVVFHLQDGVTEDKFDAALQDVIDTHYPGADVIRGKLRTFPYKHLSFIGWQVFVNGLTDEQSLLLQGHGMGKWTSCGCGIFQPARP